MENTTLASKFTEATQQFADRVAVQIKNGNHYQHRTYRNLYQLAQNIAHFLQQQNFQTGDKIAILLENCPEWIAIYFAIMYLGATAVPIDPQTTPNDLNYLLTNSDAKLLFTSDALLKNFTFEQCQIITTLHEIFTNINPHLPHLENKISSDNLASILYTSGTTGKPKGVMLSHQNFYANFCSIEKLQLLSGQHNMLCVLPFHHAFPFMVNLLLPLFTGYTITLLKNLTSEEIVQTMREKGVTVLVAVPQFYEMIYRRFKKEWQKLSLLKKSGLSMVLGLAQIIRKYTNVNFAKIIMSKLHHSFGKKLQFLISGGAKLDIEVANFLTKLGFMMLEGYGLTETSPVVTFNRPNLVKIGSVGKPLPDVEISIRAGEIIIKGLNVMLGYYKNPEETQQSLHDNWFYSGDLGYIDKAGFLFITGRKKELIVLSSGKNIVPEEVENHYTQSPFIKELCVLAVGEKVEEKLSAVIVPNFDYFHQTGHLNITSTIKWELEKLSKNSAPYQKIMGFVITKESLPRTRLGKLQRFMIAAKYQNVFAQKAQPRNLIELSAQDLAILTNPLSSKIIEIIKTVTDFSYAITPLDHLELDLGIDSLK